MTPMIHPSATPASLNEAVQKSRFGVNSTTSSLFTKNGHFTENDSQNKSMDILHFVSSFKFVWGYVINERLGLN